jgi:hypothetical protein
MAGRVRRGTWFVVGGRRGWRARSTTRSARGHAAREDTIMRVIALGAAVVIGFGLYALADDKTAPAEKAAGMATAKATGKATSKAGTGSTVATAKDKAGPPAISALAPHPLDSAFTAATDPRTADEGLLNNAHFQKAIVEALAAKRAAEGRTPGAVGPSPAQAARAKFLEVLSGAGADAANN